MKKWPENFTDVANVTGNFSLAFFIHNGVTNILANAKHPKSNPSNLFFGYLNVLIIYGFVGIFGKHLLLILITSIIIIYIYILNIIIFIIIGAIGILNINIPEGLDV